MQRVIDYLLQSHGGEDGPGAALKPTRRPPPDARAIARMWHDIEEYQPLTVKALPGSRIMRHSIVHGKSVAGLAALSIKDIPEIQRMGETPIWFGYGRPDLYDKGVNCFVESTRRQFSAHNIFLDGSTHFYFSPDIPNGAARFDQNFRRLHDAIHKAKTPADAAIARQAMEEYRLANREAVEEAGEQYDAYIRDYFPKSKEPLFLDASNGNVVIGNFKVIKQHTDFFTPGNPHYYRTLLPNADSAANHHIKAMVSSLGEFSRAIDSGA